MAVTKVSKLESLFKRLGEIDKERRQIFEDIKKSPEGVIKLARNYFDEFIKSNKWFLQEGEKNKKYKRLNSYVIKNEKPFLSSAKQRPQLQVEIEWLVYDEKLTSETNIKQTVMISVFSDLETQIRNGMKIVQMDEKTLRKKLLNTKKLALKKELADLDVQIKNIK